ncbi:MAG: tetratricopeptide repeat protein [Gammaproteobacteria bacterium]|nr:tetratricopeptide repeat protein [Gammaproteobacteria bacterium]
MSGYSTKQVAELIGINSDQVRHYVRRKLVQPERGERREFRFSFQDVVLLRTAKGLLDAKVSTRKTYRALVKLKAELAQAKTLASLRIYANGSDVVVRDDASTWEVETGQTTLDFSIQDLASDLAGKVAQIAEKHVRQAESASDLDTDEWYNLGLDLEEVEPQKAPDAYKQAIRLDPKNADAHVNLGRLYQLDGDLKYAKRHYELALTARPSHQLAYYNLGTVFDELDEVDKAAEFYEKAPAVPDAHFNLARISELDGDEVSALRHMRHYRDILDQEAE